MSRSTKKMLTDTRVDAFFEYGYLFFVALLTLMAFRYTTMLTDALLPFTDELVRKIRLAAILFVCAKTAWERSWRLWELLLAALTCGSLCRAWQLTWNAYTVELAVLFLGAHGVRFRKIALVWLCACTAALAATVILALSGVIENLIYYREGRARISFGAVYPTDFSAHVFFIAACWAWLRGRRVSFAEPMVMVGAAAFCYIFCQARNTSLCLILLAAGLIYVKLRRMLAEKRDGGYRMAGAAQWLLVLSAPLLAAAMILLTALYAPGSRWMDILDRALSGRLSLGHEGFARYAILPFGQPVELRGLGATNGLVEDYFYLDSSYVNILLRFGFVPLLAVLLALCMSALREKRAHAWERLGILAVVALHCVIEHHLLEFCYDPFLLLPLALSGADEARRALRSPGRKRGT